MSEAKRSRCLEEAIKKANKGKSREEQTKKLKIGLFCETRWVEKQNTLVNFDEMFQAITGCLEYHIIIHHASARLSHHLSHYNVIVTSSGHVIIFICLRFSPFLVPHCLSTILTLNPYAYSHMLTDFGTSVVLATQWHCAKSQKVPQSHLSLIHI